MYACRRILHNILETRSYSTKKLFGMSLSNNKKIWNPCLDLLAKVKEDSYSVVILNTPINFSFNPGFIVELWSQAKVKITVDGGTERWLTWLTMNQTEFKSIPDPDLITGDMDSLSRDIIKYYEENKSTKIVTTPDQDETDYFKALMELKHHCCKQAIDLHTVYVLADTCGRLDQIMGNINTLFKCKDILGDITVLQLAASSLSWLLEAGIHVIHIPETLRNAKEWCALLPVGGSSIVTTTGLKWNLDKQKLEFGGLVSSSNTYDGSTTVTIETNAPLLWSMGIESLL